MAKFSDNSQAQIIWDDLSLSLSTLANQTAIIIGSKIDAAREMGMKILKTEYLAVIEDLHANDNGRTLWLGLAHDLVGTEIDACLSADLQRRGDPTLSSQANRPVWMLGLMLRPLTNPRTEGVIKLGWSIPEGTVLNWFLRNDSGAPLTTGATLRIVAKHYGVWLRD